MSVLQIQPLVAVRISLDEEELSKQLIRGFSRVLRNFECLDERGFRTRFCPEALLPRIRLGEIPIPQPAASSLQLVRYLIANLLDPW